MTALWWALAALFLAVVALGVVGWHVVKLLLAVHFELVKRLEALERRDS